MWLHSWVCPNLGDKQCRSLGGNKPNRPLFVKNFGEDRQDQERLKGRTTSTQSKESILFLKEPMTSNSFSKKGEELLYLNSE